MGPEQADVGGRGGEQVQAPGPRVVQDGGVRDAAQPDVGGHEPLGRGPGDPGVIGAAQPQAVGQVVGQGAAVLAPGAGAGAGAVIMDQQERTVRQGDQGGHAQRPG